MWSLICIYLLVATTGQLLGIELSLTTVNRDKNNDSIPCGNVRCREEIDASSDDTIKSLIVRKQLNGAGRVLVTLSKRQPFVNSNAGDTWAVGTSTSNKAEVYIIVYNWQDCTNAEFICEITNLDKLGAERTSFSSGRINSKSSIVTHNGTEKCDQQINTPISVDTTCPREWAANITQSLSSFADLESKVERLTKSDSEILSTLKQLGSRVESLAESVSEILGRLHPSTCSRRVKPPQDKRYEVVHPLDGSPNYLCDTDGGWTIIQRRTNNETDFYRNWSSYKDGFGTFDGNFWLGLEQIHKITSKSNHELMVRMMYKGKIGIAHYNNFRLSGEKDKYKLSIGAYKGTAGDALSFHKDSPFSTFDQNNDSWGNCAKNNHGAWWYNACHESNLNGKWGATSGKGVRWGRFTRHGSASMSEMKMRRML